MRVTSVPKKRLGHICSALLSQINTETDKKTERRRQSMRILKYLIMFV